MVPSKAESALGLRERVFLASGLALSAACGTGQPLLALATGRYVTASVLYEPFTNTSNAHLRECLPAFAAIGCVMPILAFLQHLCLESLELRTKALGHHKSFRTLGLIVRDVVQILAGLIIAFSTYYRLAIAFSILPILIALWTVDFGGSTTIRRRLFRGFQLGGLQLFFFLKSAIGVLYGAWLFEDGLLAEPGQIFTVLVGIAVGAFQIPNLRTNLNSMRLAGNVTQTGGKSSTPSGNVAVKLGPDNGSAKNPGTLRTLSTVLRTSGRYPLLFLAGVMLVAVHAIGYPAFTRLSGEAYSVFEDNLETGEFVSNMQWVSLAYTTMGVLIIFAIPLYSLLFGKTSDRLTGTVTTKGKVKCVEDELSNPSSIHLSKVPAYASQIVYGFLCIFFSICSAVQKSPSMGSLTASIFVFQVALQFASKKYLPQSLVGKAFYFASMNGWQQLSQALCYIGGYTLIQYQLVIPSAVFKIVQMLHFGSMGMTILVTMVSEMETTVAAVQLSRPNKSKDCARF